MKPKICVLADVKGWAWDRKAQQYARYLSDEFDVRVHHQRDNLPAEWDFDLVHCFEVSQTGHVPQGYWQSNHACSDVLCERQGKLVAGMTAHVWPTWGVERVREWASRCDALHGNSVLLANEMRQFHERVFYTPNGVDADFWQRTTPRDLDFIACHVGKPNPRKGAHMIIEACERAGIPLLLCQRTSHIAIPQERLRDEFYSRAWVQITMSDMDGTPNPMLEAAACSVALISTRIGNMPEFIDNGHGNAPGILVERDADALAAALSWCLSNRNHVLEMGHEARETVLRDWTWAKQCEHVRQMWRAVLA